MLLPLPHGSIPDDVVEGLPVQLPERDVLLGVHGGGAGAVVEQRELPEEVALTASLHHLLLATEHFLAVHDALLDDVHHLPVRALRDQALARLRELLNHGEHEDVQAVCLQSVEEEALRQHLENPGRLLLSLLMHRRGECLDLVPVSVGLGRDGNTLPLLQVRPRRRRVVRRIVLLLLLFHNVFSLCAPRLRLLLFLLRLRLLLLLLLRGFLPEFLLQLPDLLLQLDDLGLQLLRLPDASACKVLLRLRALRGEPLHHEGHGVVGPLQEDLRHQVFKDRVDLGLDVFLMLLRHRDRT
mmetsp:Transcript_77373/g.196606  ORF Transcript_77373/g.196606 Transcript_77373/m.196606 type:complete len:297 (+) Transcript_77373:659-1549(+)